ncbi:unnamed protein product, partial [marine sediment metagenome]
MAVAQELHALQRHMNLAQAVVGQEGQAVEIAA